MNAVIIEDVKLVAKELAFRIAEIDPAIRIVETLPSVKTALNWFGRKEVIRLRPPHHTTKVLISRHKAPAFNRWLNQ